MMNTPQANWVALRLLRNRFAANVAAIAQRDRDLADQLTALVPSKNYHIRVEGDRVLLGAGEPGSISPMPQAMSPAAAQQTQAALFPDGNYKEPVLIAGEDLGWLLNSLYQMPSRVGNAPGYRPPLFFLVRDLERFWAILHVQDWEQLLADNRVRLFAGTECVEQWSRSMVEHVMCRWPKLSVDIDPTIWQAGKTFDGCYSQAMQRQTAELQRVMRQIELAYAGSTPTQLAELFQSGRPLRVLGITSRYTTFIQYSMRDWLAAFERLGHQTLLLIEAEDHELPNNLAIAHKCDEFHPDLVIAIDHFRAELAGLPVDIPAVMWVQDRLPNIYCADAGDKQGRLDYVIGQSLLELTQNFGYPASRFLPTMMAVNESRFLPRELSTAERSRFGCEVSFVSNAAVPAEQLLRQTLKTQSPLGVKFLTEVFRRLRAVYDAGDAISSGDILRSMIEQTARDLCVNTDIDAALELFTQRINNALFRHQAIRWVAEMGVDLRLYGKGWENHPEFSRYARGVADNQTTLPIVYQASAINLQVTPFGAVHQRLLEGITAGGFFLLRSVAADDLELILRDMDNWCRQKNVQSGEQMFARRDAELLCLAQRYAELGGINPLSKPEYFFGALGECALSGYTRTANTLWDNSSQVTFSTCEQLQSQIRHFLSAPEERREIAASMRQRVLETHTYQSVTRRMLSFIAGDLQELTGRERKTIAA